MVLSVRLRKIRIVSRMYTNLNPTKALIWRIVHRDNLPWIFDNGLHCANSSVQAPSYVAIGNPDLISRRKYRVVPIAPSGTLADYVPFYFTPFSPMMYNIYTGRGGVPKRRNEDIFVYWFQVFSECKLQHCSLYSQIAMPIHLWQDISITWNN
jgi:hypothetical protein